MAKTENSEALMDLARERRSEPPVMVIGDNLGDWMVLRNMLRPRTYLKSDVLCVHPVGWRSWEARTLKPLLLLLLLVQVGGFQVLLYAPLLLHLLHLEYSQ